VIIVDVDAGLAALLGATVGVVGTAATALTTAWVTRWQVRQQIEAERQGRRDLSRRDAYMNLFSAVTAVRSALAETVDALGAQPVSPDKCDELFSAARRLGREWDAACATLQFEGPDAVARAAWPLIETVNQQCEVVRNWCAAVRRGDAAAAAGNSNEYPRLSKEAHDNMDAFVEAVRAVRSTTSGYTP